MICFLFPALTGWANFWRAYGAGLSLAKLGERYVGMKAMERRSIRRSQMGGGRMPASPTGSRPGRDLLRKKSGGQKVEGGRKKSRSFSALRMTAL